MEKLNSILESMEKGIAEGASLGDIPPIPRTDIEVYKHTNPESLKSANRLLYEQFLLKNASKYALKQKPILDAYGLAPPESIAQIFEKHKKVYDKISESMLQSQKLNESV